MALSKVEGNKLTHGEVKEMLRVFPENRVLYAEMREHYREKVAERIRTLTTLSVTERFAYLKQRQHWVLERAKIPDIASYLAITPDMVKALMK